MKSRMQEKYRNETIPALMKRLGLKNVMAVPKVSKITVNIGLAKPART
jgi:large subunit ribosomal protein L5